MFSINLTRNNDNQMFLLSTVTGKKWSALLEFTGKHFLFEQGCLGNLFTCTVIQLLDKNLLPSNFLNLQFPSGLS